MSADLFQTFGLAEMRNLAVSDCIIGLISELMSGQRRTLRLMSKFASNLKFSLSRKGFISGESRMILRLQMG